MGETTNIEWTDKTWGPWEGCTKVSAGCANCYAEARNQRFHKGANWGKGKPRRRTVDWDKPRRWEAVACKDSCGIERTRVFPSLCDWLDDEVPIEWLADFLKLIYETPNLDWLLLTKRPENWMPRIMEALNYCAALLEKTLTKYNFLLWLKDWAGATPPTNVWIGVSVENQATADERIPELLRIPARIHFLSVEPMLEAVNMELWTNAPRNHRLVGTPELPAFSKVDWVIFGGESGKGARVCDVNWIRDGVKQCQAAGLPVFVKQLGSQSAHGHWRGTQPDSYIQVYTGLIDSKGGDMAEWPADLRIRQLPQGNIEQRMAERDTLTGRDTNSYPLDWTLENR